MNKMAKQKPIDLTAIVLAISLLTSVPLSLASAQRVNAVVAPIRKDSYTALYIITLTRTRFFLIDLASPIVWSTCTLRCTSIYICPTNTKFSLFQSNSPICNEAQSFRYPDCQSVTNSTPAPIKPPPGFCKCVSSTKNPVTGVCFSGDVTTISLVLASTDGRNPTVPLVYIDFVNICSPDNARFGLPSGTEGAAGFGRTSLVSLPARIALDLSFHNEFVLCLPSSGSGVAFFGSKPYFFMPPDSPDLSKFLSYTTLLKGPNIYDAAYYLDVSGLAVNRKAVSIRRRDLQFHSRGHGGVKLSTTIPYTIMRTKIYKKFSNAFKRATKGIPKMPAVKPFELCFNRKALSSTRLGYGVPAIDIMLSDGKNWTIFGANSIKDVTSNTSCLAFVDGGQNETTAITLGGFQMENSFLHFDVPNSILGFIPTLLGLRTTCSNFNFTNTAWAF